MEATMPIAAATASVPKKRVLAVDLLRLLALFQMVNGHTLDAVLDESARGGALYDRYLWVRGLVSVAFLVVSGLAFHLAVLARFERAQEERGRRVVRALFIAGIGWFLNAPSIAIPALATSATTADLLRFDVLQCIGLSLLALEALTAVFSTRRSVALAAGVLAALIVALAPLGDAYAGGDGPMFLRAMLGRSSGSPFPLVPWSAYIFAGTALGALAYPEGNRTNQLRAALAIGAAAILVLGVSRLVALVPISIDVPGSSRSAFWLERLGAVLALLAVLAAALSRVTRLPRLLEVLSGETLALYVFHILVLFGTPIGPALIFGKTLPLEHALLIAGANVIVSFAFGLYWHRLKARWLR
jgi:uncharacterized membrane protein